MANTYTQIHIQAIFAVKDRTSLIRSEWENELYKYITGIIQNHEHKLLQINGMPDHLHVFFGMRPKQSVSELLKIIKRESSRWVNEKGFLKSKFSWQEGYGAFSYGKSQVSDVIEYVRNQKEHHRKKTFIQEYTEFLDAFEVDFNEQYIFRAVV